MTDDCQMGRPATSDILVLTAYMVVVEVSESGMCVGVVVSGTEERL